MARRDRSGADRRSPEVVALMAQIAGARSRGAVKRLGAHIDQDAALRAILEAELVRRGQEVDPSWAGKRLVRAARDREAVSRVRSNPIKRDTPFSCGHCGADVARGGARVRDHCPRCLRSLHVDNVPGDRAADCGGLYDPVALTRAHGEVVISYSCRRCGAQWRGRAHPDDDIPADFQVGQLPGPGSRSAQEPKATDCRRGGRVHDKARTLPLRVLETIRRERLWAAGDSVVVAVSGGLDSSVLVELLADLSAAHGGRLQVVSVDHGLRPEAAAEVVRVGRQAAALGLPFTAMRLEIQPGAGVAARAREARWTALRSLKADVVATGHHRDDQAETVLQHLLRGSGARGLRGMLPRDGDRVRPMLFEPRDVLQSWAEHRGLRWVDDPSNPLSERGRLRELMTSLEELRAGAAGGLARSARLVARDDAFVDDLTQQRWRALTQDGALPVAAWSQEPDAIRLRLLLRLTAEVPHGVSIRGDRLERLLLGSVREGTRVVLSAGWEVTVEDGLFQVRPPQEK